MLPEKSLRHFIPQMFQRLIHCKCPERSSGYASQRRPVKVKVQIQSLHVVRADPCAGLFGHARDVFGRKAEDKPESQRRALSADQIKAVSSETAPQGVRSGNVCVKEIRVNLPVDVKGVECGELPFDKAETVKGVFQEKV